MTWSYDPKTATVEIKHSEVYRNYQDNAIRRAWTELGLELMKNMKPGSRYEIAHTLTDAEIHDQSGVIPGVRAIHIRCTLTGPLQPDADDRSTS